MNKSESKYFNTAVKMDLALISLLKKKTFEYITVSEICKIAGVNRSTFYLHYENIGDLLDETTKFLLDKFFSYFYLKKEDITLNYSNCDREQLNFICDEYLIPYLTYIKENKEIFLTVFRSGKSLGFDKIYKRMFDNIFSPILEKYNYPIEDRKFVMMYYLNGINAINIEWLKNDCKRPVKEVANVIKVCILGLNNEILNNEM